MKKTFWAVAAFILFVACGTGPKAEVIENCFTPLQTVREDGVLGERINLWRNHRLGYIRESGYLIDGFEHRPGTHAWQGEHLGKWLHAATMAYLETKDESLRKSMDELVERLLNTQLEDGYLGTYAEGERFTDIPETVDPRDITDDVEPEEKNRIQAEWNRVRGGWDTWTFRYNLYGLLFHERYFPDRKVVEACRKMGDLLIDVYGEGKHDLTKYGTRRGLSATTLLESIVMLYERTGERKYLDFAEHIVAMSERNPRLRLMGTLLNGGSVVWPGEGKGYQLMSNLLGYLRLYRSTGKEDYLTTVLNAWEDIRANHLLTTGGPWSRKTAYNGNNECFAHRDAFNPREIVVEGCCDATWIQMNIHLFELTGDAKYYGEAERTLINSVYAHQNLNGISWCYYIRPNEPRPPYTDKFHCCGSSEPRGLEMYSRNLVGVIGDHLTINSFGSSTVELSSRFGSGSIRIASDFPMESSARMTLNTEKTGSFVMEFRLPANTRLLGVKVNGEEIRTVRNARGYHEIRRKWENGDAVDVEFENELKYTLEKGENGRTWIAFTYGPMALARKIQDFPTVEPLKGLDIEHLDVDQVLERLPGKEIRFRIRGSDSVLIPYLLTSSGAEGGPYTYFEI